MIEGNRIFVTGASGFIGRALVANLLQTNCREVVCLSRTENERVETRDQTALRWVQGDLLDPGSYREALAGSEIVFHLGAATGACSAAEHRRVNFEGTAALVDTCRVAGVDRFIFVSSIAAGYEDLSDYPYARSKRDAEAAVAESGLDATIIRPTIVLGKGSQTGASLLRSASSPFAVVVGNGNVKIQPVHVDDVARGLAELAADDSTVGQTVDLGGRDVLSWNEWFIHAGRIATGREPKLIHVPVWLVLPVLRGLERILKGRLPITAGQLSAFRHDGVATCNATVDRIKGEMRDLDTMIRDSIPAVEARRPGRMELEQECQLFARHLVGKGVGGQLIEAYRRAHEEDGPLTNEAQGFERKVLAMARKGGLRLSIADAYVRLLLPTSILRRKLIMVTALLENSVDGADRFNMERSRGAIFGSIKVLYWGMRYALLFAVGALVLGPRHLFEGDR